MIKTSASTGKPLNHGWKAYYDLSPKEKPRIGVLTVLPLKRVRNPSNQEVLSRELPTEMDTICFCVDAIDSGKVVITFEGDHVEWKKIVFYPPSVGPWSEVYDLVLKANQDDTEDESPDRVRDLLNGLAGGEMDPDFDIDNGFKGTAGMDWITGLLNSLGSKECVVCDDDTIPGGYGTAPRWAIDAFDEASNLATNHLTALENDLEKLRQRWIKETKSGADLATSGQKRLHMEYKTLQKFCSKMNAAFDDARGNCYEEVCTYEKETEETNSAGPSNPQSYEPIDPLPTIPRI